MDYAGLFPPAEQPMDRAVTEYASYLGGPNRFALGRFIIPVSRLGELVKASSHLQIEKEWRVSAIAGMDAHREAGLCEAFNDAQAGRFVIDALEMKAASPRAIESSIEAMPDEFTAYYEIPLSDPSGFLAVLRCSRGRAKIRCGGVTTDSFPGTAEIASFLKLAAASTVPFKATAGLHHPLRSIHSLSYDENGASGWMHGFLNLTLASAFVREGMAEDEAGDLLNETRFGAFRFEPDAVQWRDWKLGSAHLAATRVGFLTSIGSCSFREPIEDLEGLGLL